MSIKSINELCEKIQKNGSSFLREDKGIAKSLIEEFSKNSETAEETLLQSVGEKRACSPDDCDTKANCRRHGGGWRFRYSVTGTLWLFARMHKHRCFDDNRDVD